MTSLTDLTDLTEQQDRDVVDFYDFEAALTEEEREILLRTRAFMRDEVQPLVAGQWAAGTFPRELVARFRESGLVGLPYEGYGGHGRDVHAPADTAGRPCAAARRRTTRTSPASRGRRGHGEHPRRAPTCGSARGPGGLRPAGAPFAAHRSPFSGPGPAGTR
jgi:hypothetical protein